MFCQKCGQNNQDLAKFCSRCGASLGGLATPNDITFSTGPMPDQMTFGKAISTCLSKYADFKGRATRSEYWWFILFTLLASIVAAIIDPTEVLANVLSLVFFLPSLAAAARRLHDGNRSGCWPSLSLALSRFLSGCAARAIRTAMIMVSRFKHPSPRALVAANLV